MPTNIRPCNAADLPEVSALLAATWHATYDAIFGAERVADITGRWHAVERLAQDLEHPKICFLIAEDGDRLIATSLAGDTGNGLVRLARLYVLPEAQGRGHGRALLEATLAAFPAATAVDLEVEPANEQAVRFYEAQGFAVTGQGTDCGGEGEEIPHLIMARQL